MLILFLKAILIGFAMAIPTGPVGVLCINSTLEKNQKSGLLIGLGSVFGDMFYAILVVSSMGGIIHFLNVHQFSLKIIAFLLIAGLGIKIMRQKAKQKQVYSFQSNLRDRFTWLILTVTNPSVILSFLLAFSITQIIVANLWIYQKIFIVLWIMAGALIWWITLSSVVRVFRRKMTPKLLKLVNLISWSLLVILAIGVLISGFLQKF